MTAPHRTHSLVVAALACALFGCASTVPVELSFPTSETFRATELVSLDVIRVGPDALDACPQALRDAMRTSVIPDLAVSLEATNVCDVRAGLQVPDPGAGVFAFVALGYDSLSGVILAGCTIGDVYPGAPPVRIELFPQELYDGTPAAGDDCAGGAP